MKLFYKIAMFLLTITFAYEADAKQYYVAQTDSGNGTGSSYANRMSIKSHNGFTFSPGDVIIITGRITSTVIVPSSGSSDSKITYDGNAGINPPALIDRGGSGYGFHILAKENIILQNLEIQNCEEGVVINGKGDTGSNNILIRNCKIHHIKNRGIFSTTDSTTYDSINKNIIIGGSESQGNEIYNIGTSTAGYDIKVAFTEDAVISYNHCYSNSVDYGISGISWEGGSKNLLIEYNKVHDHNRLNKYGENGIGGKNGENIIIRFNHIFNHNSDPNGQAGIVLSGNWKNIFVYGNRVHNNGINIYAYDGPNGTRDYYYNSCGDGISSGNIHIFNNIIYESKDWSGILIGSTSCSGANASPDDVEYVYIYNNLIANNATSAWNDQETGIHLRGHYSNIQIKNNIFYKNRPNEADYRHVRVIDDNGVTFQHNRYYWPGVNGKPVIEWAGVNKSLDQLKQMGQEISNPEGKEGDPLFLNSEIQNFKLTENSECLKEGKNLSGFAGSVTIAGKRYDIFYEFFLNPNTTNWSRTSPIVETMNLSDSSAWPQGPYGKTFNFPSPVLKIVTNQF